ncbi:uncharacterized protein LOC133199840 [Saccostrea echinata]|uniref:uncharacterized protein LOC133199840 n=1 Tax=Saccostrea echinata TaxID=191078 RepID=UPI002A7F1270|nr:uncharacterized protein LOC133199840 [Saccostrea echinata]
MSELEVLPNMGAYTSSATQSIAEIQPRKYDVLARPNTPKEVKRAIFVHGNPVDEEEKPFQDIQVTSSPTQRIGKIQPRKYGVLTRPDIKKEVKHAMSVHGNPVDEEEKQFQSGKVTSSPTQRIGKIQPRKYGVLTRPDIKKEVKHAMSVHGNPVDEEEKPFQSGKVTSSPTQRIGKIQLRKYGVLTRPDIKKEVKHAMSVHGNPVDEEEKPFQSGKDASFSSITIPGVNGVYHISYVTSEKLWVSDNEWLLQVDFSGHEIEKTKTHLLSFTSRKGFHTVTMDGSLLFIDDYNNVQEVTSKGTNTTLITAKEGCEKLLCVHSSRINGDILLGCEDALIRYDRTGQQILDFMNGLRRGIYYPIYITENNNGDIWVSDEVRKAVVVVDKLKRERFYYRGQTPYSDFKPYGICTDILGQVLVCDDAYQNPSVHLLDHECRFLRLVLTRKHGIRHPLAVCVDEKQNLYLGQRNNMIKLYKYEGRSISNASYDISY